MKKIPILFLILMSCFAISGCQSIIDYGKEKAYDAEIKHATEWKEAKLEEKILELIKEGKLTELQAEEIRKGAYWLLDDIINRAESKLKAMKTPNTCK